jgi:L-ectoine synthase
MIIRNLDEVPSVDWGNGLSRRFLVASDGVGYSITDTIVNAGTKSHLEYRNHLETCYCIGGSGEVIDESGQSFPLVPGTLVAAPHEDLHLVCVFSPALVGDERHSLDDSSTSHY